MTMRKLNIVHVCDHLGWAGSRMHGVKRLFAWMMPRFDRTRFTASLISLRRKDLSDDTLEQFGIDVTYLGRHKFDPATFTHLLKVLQDKRADVVHLHGYGATTFGRLCAAWMGIPAILHEHANHTDTPWFQKVADRALAPFTDLAIAVSASTAEFTTRARLMPADRTHVVYLGAPLDEFARPRQADEIAEARRSFAMPEGTVAIGCVTRLMPSKGNEFLVAAAPAVLAAHPEARFYLVGEGELAAPLEAQAARSGSGTASCSPASGAMSRRRSAPSTWWCSRRCGRARRSPPSRRWRWASRSSRPTPTACSTCWPTAATRWSCRSATARRSRRRSIA